MIADKKVINKAVDYIKEVTSPEKVYLFGSYARGNPNENSDLDFFIIKETNLPKPKRVLSLYALGKTKRIGVPIGIDFIIYTPKEFEEKKNDRNSLVGEVIRNGVLLYDSKTSP